jgi:hypothetical protein
MSGWACFVVTVAFLVGLVCGASIELDAMLERAAQGVPMMASGKVIEMKVRP